MSASASKNDLRRAIQEGNVEKAIVLFGYFTDPIYKSAFVNEPNGYSRSLLHSAVQERKTEMAKLLILHGADVNSKDPYGETPLHLATLFHHPQTARSCTDIAELLLANGADVNVKDNNNQTPLHTAVEKGIVDMIRLLLDNDADITVPDSQSNTPRDLASPEIQTILDNRVLVRTMWSIWQENNANLTDSYAKWPPQELLGEILEIVDESKPPQELPDDKIWDIIEETDEPVLNLSIRR